MALPTIPEVSSSNFDPFVFKCESFINDRLREDLRLLQKRQESIHVQVNNYQDLKSFVVEARNGSFGRKNIKTQFDLGCNFYMRCTIAASNKLVVFIGLGLYMEFTYDEALMFIDKRCKYLDDCLSKLSDQACNIKAHIKVMLDTLGYLQGIQATEEEED